MPETAPRCPDCGVTTEAMTLRSGGGYELSVVSEENREGILGKLGIKQRYSTDAHVCPECGLVRLYADVDEE